MSNIMCTSKQMNLITNWTKYNLWDNSYKARADEKFLGQLLESELQPQQEEENYQFVIMIMLNWHISKVRYLV